MVIRPRTLGTLLRHLVDLLDGDVEAAYTEAGLDWRPRYTPVLRALMREGEASIRAMSRAIGISHSAVSQTVSQMQRDGLVEMKPGADARERIVALSPKAEAMIPALQRQWAATNAAADQLDAELSAPLSTIASEAIDALTQTAFGERIRRALETPGVPNEP
ncbi:MarR family winged helix-turn-helix transcriptional regulator [Sphingomonas sp.]|uniref:MarR family winged helix-turn-helix transcriptional regulator n=1 Tax=Sphingomonas sp. TaxID=28214 RepID=UPI003B3AA1FD